MLIGFLVAMIVNGVGGNVGALSSFAPKIIVFSVVVHGLVSEDQCPITAHASTAIPNTMRYTANGANPRVRTQPINQATAA